MTSLHHFHEHPLTVCENNDFGELLCYGCDDPFLGESYFCSKCGFDPERCFACDKRPSGSFYICKQCWPKSPLFHKSCVDLPPEIQITYRPRCSLNFEVESSGSKGIDCDFCNQKHWGFKFLCDECDFQIGFGCAAMLIKYHQGRECIENFSHRHPLTLLEEVEDTETSICKLCYEKIDGPSYACAPCEFYIHKSCGELPQEIRHPFHPANYLTLQQDISGGEYQCVACCFSFRGLRYKSDRRWFDLHPECTSLKPNIKHKDHEHLLTLIENMFYQSRCETCGFEIQGTFFLRCVECRFDFHVQCGSLPLPLTVVHKQHKHTLRLSTETLVKDDSYVPSCDACKKQINTKQPFYCCDECEYFSHARCAITEVEPDDRGKLRHFSHQHILILHENQENIDILCYGCGKGVRGLVYGCHSCKFYLHKSCAELPREIHGFHEHCLTLQRPDISAKGTCDTCHEHFNGFIYHCEACQFDLDLDCASLHPSINNIANTDDCKSDGLEKFGHFSHHHLLILLEVNNVDCNLCHKNIHGLSYSCSLCQFYIHRSCGELLEEIRHPFHARHSLKLQKIKSGYVCNACNFKIDGFGYQCNKCNIGLHLECVSLKPNLRYQGHEHLLTLIENNTSKNLCHSCDFRIDDFFFMRCVDCHLNFHIHCGPKPLPPIFVPKQHAHPLTLRTKTFIKDDSDILYCNACQKERNPKHPVFHCVECKYYVHVHCIISEIEINEREKLRHFSHKHFLFLLENKNNDNIMCIACEKHIHGDPAYGCDVCKFYLHKSCAELPREKQHSLHRHPLTLPIPYSRKHHECNSCHRYCYGFTYCCKTCKFNLDLDCSFLEPSIKFKGHPHTLTLLEKSYDNPECKRCNFTPTDKLSAPNKDYLRCIKCNFNIHLLCSELPNTIEHGSHQHPVTLKDNFFDLFDYYSDNEYYCDACETKREDRECVYYCEECSFVVDIKCAISEVINCLEGKRGDIELRAINREITSRGLTYNEMIESFTVQERITMMNTRVDVNEEFEEVSKEDRFRPILELAVFCSLFPKNPFLMGTKYTEEMVPFEIEPEDFETEVVNVGDYKIIPKFAPILRNLLDKYGDFGASCTWSQRLKTIPLLIFCATLQNMSSSRIIITEDKSIFLWWYYLKLVQGAGFSIDFALDHLKRLLSASHGTSSANSRNSPLYNPYKEIASSSQGIDELYREIGKLTRRIDKQKAHIERLRKRAKEIVLAHSSEQSRSEAKRLSEALELVCMNAADGLL